MKIRNITKLQQMARTYGWVGNKGAAPAGGPIDDGFTDETDPTKRLAPDGSGGVEFRQVDVDELATAETDSTKVARPVGAGGVTFGTEAGGGGNDVVWPLGVAMPPWVKPSGSGVITADAQGRLTLDSDSTYKSFPSMAYLAGRLHLVYRSGSAHNSSGGVIKYRYSDSDGRAWSAATTIVSPTAGDDLRDPSLLAMSTGRLLLAYDYQSPWNGATIGTRIRHSDDRGLSWSSAYTPPNSIGTNEFDVTSPAIELPDGTILLPGYGDVSGRYQSWVWASTDGGLTFPTQTLIASSGSLSFSETTIRQVASGTLVALIREETSGDTYRSTSTDLGATWSAAAMVIDNNVGGRPDFIELWPGVLLWFGRGVSFASRWAVSWDEGATWTALQETDSGETLNAEYHAVVVLASGYVVVVYSIENSSSDADLYVRYYHDGYGIDAIGNVLALIGGTLVSTTPPTTGDVLTATSPSTAAWAAPTAASTSYREVLMASGVTNPPDPLISSDGTDWLYGSIA